MESVCCDRKVLVKSTPSVFDCRNRLSFIVIVNLRKQNGKLELFDKAMAMYFFGMVCP
jgi:hypothetical protein